MKEEIRTQFYELNGLFSVEFPESWIFEEELFAGAKFVVIAPKLQDIEMGLGFSIIYGSASEFLVLEETKPEELLHSFALGGTDAELGKVVQLAQNEVNWARVNFNETRVGDPVRGWMACAVVEDGFVFLIASAPSEQWADYEQDFGAIFDSLSFE
jgi:hypothetical protein